MRRSLLDSGVLVGWLDRDDQHHAFCRDAMERAQSTGRLTVLEMGIAEAYSFLRRGTSSHDASVALHLFEAIDELHLDELAASRDVHARARAILRRYADQSFTYVDALTFATASEPGPWTVASTDRRHFDAYRFPRTVQLILPG